MKFCPTCETDKPPEAFNRDARRADGLQSKCRECSRRLNREWHAANRESNAEKNAAWRAANPERRRELRKAWNDANPARRAEQQARWKRANRETCNSLDASRRARKRSTESLHDEQMVDFLSRRWAVSALLGVPVELDHQIPLARGGTHTVDNVRWLPARLNRVKGGRLDHEVTDPEFREYIFGPPTFERVTYATHRNLQ